MKHQGNALDIFFSSISIVDWKQAQSELSQISKTELSAKITAESGYLFSQKGPS